MQSFKDKELFHLLSEEYGLCPQKSTQNISVVDDEVMLHQTLTIGTHRDSTQPSVELSR